MFRAVAATVLVIAVVGAGIAAEPPAGAGTEKAKKLLAIGDYAAALVELHELSKAEPENAEVRLLMARAFADCAVEIKMPGVVEVGTSNRDRAAYQLGILLKLGPKGRELFFGTIESGGNIARIAIQTAAREKLHDAIDHIEKLIDQPNPPLDLTSDVVAAMSGLKGDKAAALLKKLMERETSKDRRRWLANAYVNCLDDKAKEELLRTTKDEGILEHYRQTVWSLSHESAVILARRTDLDPAFRVSTLSRLSQTRQEKQIDQKTYEAVLLELLEDKSPEIRRAVIEPLSKIAPEKVVPLLVADLRDKDRCGRAAQLLGDMKSKAAVQPLLALLEEKTDPQTADRCPLARHALYSAITASGAEGDSLMRAVRLMLMPDPADRRPPPPVGYKRQINLPSIPAAQMPAVLGALLADESADLRTAAARALTNLDAKDGVPLARRALDDKDGDVRTAAERVILEHSRSGKVTTEDLTRLLESTDAWVLSNAARTLAQNADKGAADAMLAILTDEKRRRGLQREAAGYFAAVSDARALGPLISALLFEQSPVTPEELAKAMKNCSKDLPATARQVAKGLLDKSDIVRRKTVAALKALGEKSIRPELVAARAKATSQFERDLIDDAIRALAQDE